MRLKILISCLALLIVITYILIGLTISNQAQRIVESGMKQTTDYKDFMSDDMYYNLNPLKRGLVNYNIDYIAEHHSYDTVGFPLHFFTMATVKIDNYYNDGELSFNEEVRLKLKLKKWKWVVTNISIDP